MKDIYSEKVEASKQKINTVDDAGGRVWIHPKKPSGIYYHLRTVVSVLLLMVLFGLPFLKVNGYPAVMINIFTRKFIFFGSIFWPQDFYILVIIFLALIVFIVLFTVIFGRIFCGWICPQTIFMEMVFRKIEYWIEGDFRKQKKLKAAPWNWEKIWKRGLKHAIFIAISLLISHTFLSYILGVDKVLELTTHPITDNLSMFVGLMVFTGLFYFVFSWFREQVCLVACPYGRLQGVMLDKSSVQVIYDYIRGEPRGKKKKKDPVATLTQGDCVDCNLCVQVCPTGIDIRNGSQLECINCTACMDACDAVMDKTGRERGLIRYDTEDAVEQGREFSFNKRMMAYSVVLIALLGLAITLLMTRSAVQATVLRSKGKLYQKMDNGAYRNMYKVNVINKTLDSIPVFIQLEGGKEGEVVQIMKDWILPAQGLIDEVFFLELATTELEGMTTPIEVGIYNKNGELLTTATTKFVGPGM